MAVRRLAEDAVQPASFKFNTANSRWARETIKKYPKGRQASAVIPLLMRAQDQDGWVTKASIETIADMLGMPLIRVLEVATFYTQFQLQPVGTSAHIQVCGTTPCMLRGAEKLKEVCRRKISETQFETTPDGKLSWEEVECQGACVNAPMVMIFKDTYEDLTPQRLEEVIDAFEAGDGDTITPGPQIDRVYSAPSGGFTSLTVDPVVKKNVRVASSKSSDEAKSKSKTTSSSTKAAPKAETKRSAKSKPVSNAGATADKPNSKPVSLAAAPDASGAAKSAASATKAKPQAKQKPGSDAKSASSSVASLDDKNRPAQIEKPDSPDNLKLISGVGPKLESVLNGLGIFTFAQIGKWKKAEIEWVDGYLKFKGRIERDDWLRQAKALVKGGEAEYLKVFGKKPR